MKIIFLDIDGTLVDYQQEVPVHAIRAIRETRKKGNKVYLTTGRSKAEVYEELWEIGLDGMIGGNGMYIEDNGVVLQDLQMDADAERKAVDWLEQNQLGYYLESKNGLFANERFMEEAITALYGGNLELGMKKINEVFPEMIWDGELYRSDVAKISFLLKPGILEQARAELGEQYKISTWSTDGKVQEFGEFAIPGIDKIKGIEILLAHLNADINDTFAFGDAEPDIEMIKYCHVGIAMGNAKQALKDVADDITDDVNQDGLHKSFVKYSLI